MLIRRLLTVLPLIAALCASAADTAAPAYSFEQCEGSLTPYPETIQSINCPDSLVPV